MTGRKLTKSDAASMQPAKALWRMYDPAKAQFAFKANTTQQARAWPKRTAAALATALGFQHDPKVAPRPRKLESVDKGDYVREKIIIRTAEDVAMPVYVLMPKDLPRPMPVVLALHGHGYGVKDIVGLWEDGSERDTPDGYHKDFALALCRRGFAVIAPEISCFGERQTDFSHLDPATGQAAPSTCAHSAMLAFHLGKSVIGMRVRDARALIDYLETRSDVDVGRLGVMGISGGGLLTFFSTCLDQRIKACVVSGYYSTFKDSIHASSHCACNYVPGMHRFGEMYDLVGLIVPRPMLVEAGNRDGIFPIAAARRSIGRAKKIYELFGAARDLETDYFEGRHQISGARAYDFLWEKLA